MKKEYKSYKDLTERSIEEWARELDDCPKRELTTEESYAFIKMKTAEKEVEKKPR